MTHITQIIALIAHFETFIPCPYADRAQYSVGYGTKSTDGQCVTEPQAQKALSSIVMKHYRPLAKEAGLTKEQVAALTSLSYNIGQGALAKSNVVKLAKEGNTCQAAKVFDKWIYQSGKKLPGLVERRAKEKALFLKNLNCEVKLAGYTALIKVTGIAMPGMAW